MLISWRVIIWKKKHLQRKSSTEVPSRDPGAPLLGSLSGGTDGCRIPAGSNRPNPDGLGLCRPKCVACSTDPFFSKEDDFFLMDI